MVTEEVKFEPYKDAQPLFDILNWQLTPKEIKELTDNILDEILKKTEVIEQIPAEERTFENTIWDKDDARLGGMMNNVTFIGSISTDAEVRKASTEARQKMSQFFVELGLREESFKAVKELADKNLNLDPKDQRLLDFAMRDFKRRGFHLDKEVRDQLKTLWQENSRLAIQFRQNVNEEDTRLELSGDELEGVASNILNALEQNDAGKYLVELTGPNMMAISADCKVENTRKLMTEAWNSRCMVENTKLMDRMVVIRDQAAKLLDYKNHADYVLEVKMAEKPEVVNEFLDNIITKLQPIGRQELQELQQLKQEELSKTNPTIYLHDRAYYTRIAKERKYNVNMEKIKEYFPLTHVLNAMLEFYQEIFGFTFIQIDNAPTWHRDVTCFAIYDTNTKQFKGIFYLDLYPRAGTFGHAAAFTLIKGMQYEDGSYQATASAMRANFNKPTKQEPSLLTLSQVRTLFHEFGHIIHQTTSTAKHHRFSGTAVQRDFVEACSQILENWIYETEVLTKISKHYRTGESIPVEYVERLREYNQAMPGLVNLRQLFFGKFDMAMHTASEIDTATVYNSLLEEISLFPAPEGTNGAAAFGHLASGYDAGYYGYMWSDVIAHDMYSRFKEEGPTSKAVGMDYRHFILEQGNEKDANDLVREFLGRDFNNESFMEYLGLH